MCRRRLVKLGPHRPEATLSFSPALPAMLLARLRQSLTAPALQPTWAAIAAEIGLDHGAFLDLRCGHGWLCLHVAAGHAELDAIGLDTDPAALAIGRSNVGTRLNVTLREMSADHVVYPDRTFQAAAAVMASRGWSDPAAVFAEVWRVLAPGGRLLVYEWDAQSPAELDGWVALPGPARTLAARALARSAPDAAGWEALKDAVRRGPFGGGEEGRHGPFRRLVLRRPPEAA